jgi:hypothetical protein
MRSCTIGLPCFPRACAHTQFDHTTRAAISVRHDVSEHTCRARLTVSFPACKRSRSLACKSSSANSLSRDRLYCARVCMACRSDSRRSAGPMAATSSAGTTNDSTEAAVDGGSASPAARPGGGPAGSSRQVHEPGPWRPWCACERWWSVHTRAGTVLCAQSGHGPQALHLRTLPILVMPQCQGPDS